MSIEELSNFVRELNLPDFPSSATDVTKTLGPGLPQPVSTNSPASYQTAQSNTHRLSALCNACQSIFTDASRRRPGQIHHHGIDALRTRAGKGCQLCLSVYMSMDPSYLMKFQRTVPNSQGMASFTPTSRDQARLQFRYISATALDQESFNSTSSGQRQKGPSSVHSNKSVDAGEVHVLTVDFILVKPEYAEQQGARFIDSDSVSTESTRSIEIAKCWLSDCTLKHMKCSVAEPLLWKPKRLLDVSVRGPKGAQGVRLCDGLFADPLSEYVTLSYCYGTAKPTRLHKKTLPALRQGVAVSSLPKTIADAACITHELGFRYLWVDSLCLMQDDAEEMLSESSQMDKVYSGASLNLAATASKDSQGGLFYSRNVLAVQPCIVDLPAGDVLPGTYYCLRSTVWQDLVDRSPLAKRAWVLQERALAKRTLHFTRNELLWECQESCCAESFPGGLSAPLRASEKLSSVVSFDKKSHHRQLGNWHEIVRAYTQGGLTYRSDKLIAMSALVRQYAIRNRFREKDYVVGLWRSELPHALLWHVERGLRPTKYRAPSWTWASMDGMVQYPPPSQSSKDTCVEVIDISVKYKTDPYGLVESGNLKLRGFLVKGMLHRSKEHWDRTSCTITGLHSEFTIGSAIFDERLPRVGDEALEEVYCLPVVETVDRMEGLLLRAMEEIGRGVFRRLGAFQISRWDQVSWDRFKENMKGDPTLDNYEHRLDHANAYWFASDHTYTINIV